MNEQQANARALTLAYLTVANLLLSKPETIRSIVSK